MSFFVKMRKDLDFLYLARIISYTIIVDSNIPLYTCIMAALGNVNDLVSVTSPVDLLSCVE